MRFAYPGGSLAQEICSPGGSLRRRFTRHKVRFQGGSLTREVCSPRRFAHPGGSITLKFRLPRRFACPRDPQEVRPQGGSLTQEAFLSSKFARPGDSLPRRFSHQEVGSSRGSLPRRFGHQGVSLTKEFRSHRRFARPVGLLTSSPVPATARSSYSSSPSYGCIHSCVQPLQPLWQGILSMAPTAWYLRFTSRGTKACDQSRTSSKTSTARPLQLLQPGLCSLASTAQPLKPGPYSPASTAWPLQLPQPGPRNPASTARRLMYSTVP